MITSPQMYNMYFDNSWLLMLEVIRTGCGSCGACIRSRVHTLTHAHTCLFSVGFSVICLVRFFHIKKPTYNSLIITVLLSGS